MSYTGIIRKVDELGRIVIPIEIRNQFNIGYIQIGGRDYKYYMLGKDMIGHIELIFKFTI